MRPCFLVRPYGRFEGSVSSGSIVTHPVTYTLLLPIESPYGMTVSVLLLWQEIRLYTHTKYDKIVIHQRLYL